VFSSVYPYLRKIEETLDLVLPRIPIALLAYLTRLARQREANDNVENHPSANAKRVSSRKLRRRSYHTTMTNFRPLSLRFAESRAPNSKRLARSSADSDQLRAIERVIAKAGNCVIRRSDGHTEFLEMRETSRESVPTKRNKEIELISPRDDRSKDKAQERERNGGSSPW